MVIKEFNNLIPNLDCPEVSAVYYQPHLGPQAEYVDILGILLRYHILNLCMCSTLLVRVLNLSSFLSALQSHI